MNYRISVRPVECVVRPQPHRDWTASAKVNNCVRHDQKNNRSETGWTRWL